MRYRSVLLHGKAEFVEDYDAKVDALKIIMSHYTDNDFDFSPPAVNNVTIIKVRVVKLTGRKFEII